MATTVHEAFPKGTGAFNARDTGGFTSPRHRRIARKSG